MTEDELRYATLLGFTGPIWDGEQEQTSEQVSIDNSHAEKFRCSATIARRFGFVVGYRSNRHIGLMWPAEAAQAWQKRAAVHAIL